MNPGQQVSDERAHFDSKTADLVGRRALEVWYWDVHNFSREPNTWDYGGWHHAVMGAHAWGQHGRVDVADGEDVGVLGDGAFADAAGPDYVVPRHLPGP